MSGVKDTPHGEPGHLNIYTRDQDSVITGYGAHYRVVAFQADSVGLYCRVDHTNGPRMPTEKEILRVARLDQGVKGRWMPMVVEVHPNGTATDCHFLRRQPL